jgi:hypothetical protein
MDERVVGLAVAWVGQWEREEFCGTRRFNCVQYAADSLSEGTKDLVYARSLKKLFLKGYP